MVPGHAQNSCIPCTLDWALQQLRSSRPFLAKRTLQCLASSAAGLQLSKCQVAADEELGSFTAFRLDQYTVSAAAMGEPSTAMQHSGEQASLCNQAEDEHADKVCDDLSAPSWPPRKPLVQWAAQLESHSSCKSIPQHVGGQPSKSCLRRSAQHSLSSDSASSLEAMATVLTKATAVTHPKPPTPQLVGLKRSRMAAFR